MRKTQSKGKMAAGGEDSPCSVEIDTKSAPGTSGSTRTGSSLDFERIAALPGLYSALMVLAPRRSPLALAKPARVHTVARCDRCSPQPTSNCSFWPTT